jgi:hypothetical protein
MTNNTLKRTPTETPVRHNNISSPLRRFATMPPPSTTGRTPLTPGPNTDATDPLRRFFNLTSATNLFPDETPDTDRVSSTTEQAHFSDIDEDDPSPHDDEPPSMDDDVPVINVATDTTPHHSNDETPPTGDNALVVSPHTTPAPALPLAGIDSSSMEIDVQSPVRASQVTGTCPIPTEPTPLSIDDGAYPDPAGAVPPSAEQISSFLRHARRHATDGATTTATSAAAMLAVPLSPDVTEGDTTATVGSPENTGLGVNTYPAHITGNTNNPVGLDRTTPMGPNDDTLIANSNTAASPTLEETTASAIDSGPNDDTHIAESDTAASPTLKRKRKYSPTKAAQRRRRWYNDERDLNNTTRTPTDSGGAQAGGDGGSGV